MTFLSVSSFLDRKRKPLSWIISIAILAVIIAGRKTTRDDLIFEIIELVGYAFIIIASVGRIWCSVYIEGHKDNELRDEGPYSIVRNPLYIFSFLGLIGITLGAKNIPLTIIIIPVYWIYYYFVVRAEEVRLVELFGSEYEAYCRAVPRFIPAFKNYRAPDEMVVHPERIFRSILDALWFMWILILLEVLEQW